MASSGKNNDLEAPSFGVGMYGGSVNSGQPNLKNKEIYLNIFKTKKCCLNVDLF